MEHFVVDVDRVGVLAGLNCIYAEDVQIVHSRYHQPVLLVPLPLLHQPLHQIQQLVDRTRPLLLVEVGDGGERLGNDLDYFYLLCSVEVVMGLALIIFLNEGEDSSEPESSFAAECIVLPHFVQVSR